VGVCGVVCAGVFLPRIDLYMAPVLKFVCVCVCVCVCVFGGAGNPGSLWCSSQSSGMHLSPPLNQSDACDTDQVSHLRWHSSRAGRTQRHSYTQTHTLHGAAHIW